MNENEKENQTGQIKQEYKTNIKIRIAEKLNKLKIIIKNNPIKFSLIFIVIMAAVVVAIFFMLNLRPKTQVSTNRNSGTFAKLINQSYVKSGTYKNDSLGVSFSYPSEYIELSKKSGSGNITSFVSSSDCSNKDPSQDYLDNCYLLDVWYQNSAYEFSPYGVAETIKQLNIDGVDVKIQKIGSKNSGDNLIIIQIPRFETKDSRTAIGELVIQLTYSKTNPIDGAKIAEDIANTIVLKQVDIKSLPKKPEGDVSLLISQYYKLSVFEKGIMLGIPVPATNNYISGTLRDKKIVFNYANFNRDQNKTSKFTSMWGSLLSGLAIVDISSLDKPTILFEPGTNSYSYINWSPDGKYISYVLDDGLGMGMMDTTTKKEVFRKISTTFEFPGIATAGGRPMSWIDNSHFSYIFDGKLYVGTVDNPTSEIIASDATGFEGYYESAPVLYSPLWSSDARYVEYRSDKTLTIYDKITKQSYSFGETDDKGLSGDGLAAIEVGWTNENSFIYKDTKNNLLKSAKIVNDELKISEEKKSSDDEHYKLISGGPNVITTANGPYYESRPDQALGIYNLNTKSTVCPNMGAGKYYASYYSKDKQKDYIIASPLVSEWPTLGVSDDIQREVTLGIYDLTSCNSLGSFVVNVSQYSEHVTADQK